MKKAKVTFLPIDGTGVLHLDFQPGPFGDAVEAKKGNGIGFFSQNGDLQGVTFDDLSEEQDQQVLEFDRFRIEALISKGEISYTVVPIGLPKRNSRASKKRTENAA